MHWYFSILSACAKILLWISNFEFSLFDSPPPLDVDECSAEITPCSPNAACLNSDGSFSCTCNSGYFGDGYSCEGTKMT